MAITVELAARVIVTAACLSQLAAGVAVFIRERAASRPAPTERATGPIALVNYAGIAFFVLVGLAVAITGAGALTGVAEPLGDALRIAGILVLWVAGLLAVWGIRTMGRHLVSPAEVRPDTELVTTGPFGLVRHPMYLSILLLWAGGALALLGWVLAVGFVLLVPAFYLRARTEEGLLTRHFGDAYTAYAARVPMLLPGLRRGLGRSARVRGRASGFAATDRRPLRPERGPAATQRWPRPLGTFPLVERLVAHSYSCPVPGLERWTQTEKQDRSPPGPILLANF